ncbi:MAG: hypothetical protein ACTSRA_18340 [Promethearchaeota archaeon]
MDESIDFISFQFTDLKRKRKFNNWKLEYFNFIEKILNTLITDVYIFKKSIFILLDSEDYEKIIDKKLFSAILEAMLAKQVFFISDKYDLKSITYSIYERRFIEDLKLIKIHNSTYLKIHIKPELKQVFFHKYKSLFQDIGKMFKKVFKEEIKFQYS